jgi:predicted AlkP superfamily pyrophosphatase or phosphodiesterase
MLGELLTAIALAAGQEPRAPQQAAPRLDTASVPTLVVHITVDQCRADYLDRWRYQFTGGLARLLRSGAVFTQAYQDHAETETAPGHATVLSGRNPASTGIVNNDDGVSDTTAAGALLDVPGPGASPWRFRGTELFDWIAARYPGARALSVSRKDRGAILPIGHARQQVYWYQGGEFTTSRYYADSLPEWVRAFNAGMAPARAPGLRWDLLLPPSSYTEPDSERYERGGRDFAFPHVLPADSTVAALAVIAMPWMDSLTLALALDGVNHLELGRGPQPDLLAVSLSTTDAVGHAYGPDSREIHDQILRLDRYLGVFLDSLDRLRDPRRILVSLTADHGVTSYPEWSRTHGDPEAQRVAIEGPIRAAWTSLALRLGPGDWMGYLGGGLVTLDRPGLTARGVDVDSVVDSLAAALRHVPGVLRVDTRRTLAAADTATDPIARRWRNLVPSDLPAEVMITLRPHDIYGGSFSAQHGQPSDDDAHVPLIIAGAGVRPGRYSTRVSVVDLAPTLAYLIGVAPLEQVQGRVLTRGMRR